MPKFLKTFFLASLFLFSSQNLRAQDSCCETLSGFYLGTYGGGTFTQDSLFVRSSPAGVSDQIEYKAGWNLGAFMGYRFCSGFRLEGEIGYRKAEIDHVTLRSSGGNFLITDLSAYDFQVFNYMVNAIYECSLVFCDCCWKPYFGFGLGAVNIDYDLAGSGVDLIDDDTTFGYQLILGLAYPFSECFDLGLEYRLMGMGDADFKNSLGQFSEMKDYTLCHHLGLSAKYTFGGF